jgi:spoIIIJ-associated protein
VTDVAPDRTDPLRPPDEPGATPPYGEGAAIASLTDRPEAVLVKEGDIAGDYLERLLDIVDFDGDLDMDVEGDRAVVAVVGDRLTKLVGSNGATLDALQELTRLAVQQQTGVRSRLMLDIGGYRARRRADLTRLGTKVAREVLTAAEPASLAPMNPFERKVVHDAVAAVDGVRSESEGVEPDRYVVIVPT